VIAAPWCLKGRAEEEVVVTGVRGFQSCALTAFTVFISYICKAG